MYLDEDEVDEQVSSLKKSKLHTVSDEEAGKFGIVDGSFKWNEASEKSKADSKGKSSTTTAPKSGANGQESTNNGSGDADRSADAAACFAKCIAIG